MVIASGSAAAIYIASAEAFGVPSRMCSRARGFFVFADQPDNKANQRKTKNDADSDAALCAGAQATGTASLRRC